MTAGGAAWEIQAHAFAEQEKVEICSAKLFGRSHVMHHQIRPPSVITALGKSE